MGRGDSSAVAAACAENSSSATCTQLWSISGDSLRRYVHFASESCIQELLSASDSNRVINGHDGWKVLARDNDIEISKRWSGSLHTFLSRWLLRSISPQQFIIFANAIDAAKRWQDKIWQLPRLQPSSCCLACSQ
ncbi:uncharacterized protein LOC122071682 isoform X2 [Macadamia integrifolia]|uniref:uncharacterized protein LOC122071682 isoform X2 n=1 Tax=Macadamia integrifolia TaxID=60698 RepID=UPI001C4EB659|nr:uncharacterized protein LOC122071682 isoform X2 [Macadamia integrifolia]